MATERLTVKGVRMLSAIAKKEVPHMKGELKEGEGVWMDVLDSELVGKVANSRRGNARVANGLKRRGLANISWHHDPDSGRPGYWFELTSDGVEKCKQILAVEKATDGKSAII